MIKHIDFICSYPHYLSDYKIILIKNKKSHYTKWDLTPNCIMRLTYAKMQSAHLILSCSYDNRFIIKLSTI